MGATYAAFLFAAILIHMSLAQALTDVCWWWSPRAASIQGALYANGGGWQSSDSSITAGIVGNTYALNYSNPFFTTKNTNFSTLFTGPTAAGLSTGYYDGTMFANDDAYYLYGYV